MVFLCSLAVNVSDSESKRVRLNIGVCVIGGEYKIRGVQQSVSGRSSFLK